MKTIFGDTHPDAERFLVELLRKAPFSERLRMAASLVATTHSLSWMGLRERYPDEPLNACMERFVFHLYGDRELAEQAASCLARLKAEDRIVTE